MSPTAPLDWVEPGAASVEVIITADVWSCLNFVGKLVREPVSLSVSTALEAPLQLLAPTSYQPILSIPASIRTIRF